MGESTEDLLGQAAAAVGMAMKAFAVGAALLALVLVAGLFALLAQMAQFARLIAATLAKVAIVVFLVLATFNAAIAVWLAYGADLPAILLAALLVITMAALGLAGKNWGALLLGGLAALAIGAAISSADLVMRSLVVVGALATTIAQNQFNSQESDHENQKIVECVHDRHQDWTDLLYADQNGRFSDEHDAG